MTKEEQREYHRNYNRKHAARRKAVYAQYVSKNRETMAAKRAAKYRLKTYGLTPEAYEKIVTSQGGGCAICGCTDKLTVDHDHLTENVRGVLCQWCNSGLGQFRDSEERLSQAISYLRERKGK